MPAPGKAAQALLNAQRAGSLGRTKRLVVDAPPLQEGKRRRSSAAAPPQVAAVAQPTHAAHAQPAVLVAQPILVADVIEYHGSRCMCCGEVFAQDMTGTAAGARHAASRKCTIRAQETNQVAVFVAHPAKPETVFPSKLYPVPMLSAAEMDAAVHFPLRSPPLAAFKFSTADGHQRGRTIKIGCSTNATRMEGNEHCASGCV